LNIFRPFYLIGGIPYPWTYSEKHLSIIVINEYNSHILFEKIKAKILEYGSMLCGLLSEDEKNEEGEALK
jgi:hypothetical protein